MMEMEIQSMKGRIDMKCLACGHDIREERTRVVRELNDCIVVVEHVPQRVCPHCGETYFSDEVADRLEALIVDGKMSGDDFVVKDFITGKNVEADA